MGINVAYMDSHVKYVTIANGTANYTQDPKSKAEPMYYNFDQRAMRSSSPVGVDDNGDGKADRTIPANPPANDVPPHVTDDPDSGYWNPNFYSDML